MAETPITAALRTLLVNGYAVATVERISERAGLLTVQKRDRFGGLATSTILFAEEPAQNVVEMLRKAAEQNGSKPLIVTTREVAGIPTMTPNKFYELLGGEVRSDRVIRSDLPEILELLGHNKVPNGLKGTAEDLLEDYVKEGLEFLLESRGWRYGQERLFEALPDGLLLGRGQLNLYFDGKAYEKGFHPSADDIRRFATYVNDFNKRYGGDLGRLHAFLVVSGSFIAEEQALKDKAADLYAACGTQLCYLAAKDLGEIITILREKPSNRTAVNWMRIFSQMRIKPKSVTAEMKRVAKDQLK